MAPASRANTFLYRVEACRNSSTGAAGLGLAIVKAVLLRHEGELHISSELGQGSVFSCVFNQTVGQKSVAGSCGVNPYNDGSDN